MIGDKKISDNLTKEELKNVKGGIPYEKPELIDFEAASATYCKVGKHCESGDGSGNCISGRVCNSGSHGVAVE